MKTDRSRYKLLILLLLADFFFIVLHIRYMRIGGLDLSYLYSIGRDRGFAEIFQYIKEYWIVLMLLWLALKSRAVLFFVWSLLFLFLLFDDALYFHESAGFILAGHFNLKGNVVPDIGQLGVIIIVGVVFFAIIGISHYFSKQRFRKISIQLAILMFALAFFGVFIDGIHSVFKNSGANNFLLLIEEGGEMVIMSLITWYVFNIDQESLAYD